jgi:hypothetical protein
MLPSTFIIGVQKCGTTTLHHLLSRHPDVFFPSRPQEIHFFDVEENFRKGLGWYESLFSAWAGQKVVAQTSPLYIFEPRVPERIAAVVPEARLVVIFRNPVDRAYSHYWHSVKHGLESKTFERAIELEDMRLNQGFEARRQYSYLRRGAYAEQFSRYLRFFARDQILALRLEDLSANADQVLDRCAHFLSIARDRFAPGADGQGARNPARMPRSRTVQRLAGQLGRVSPAAGSLISRLNMRTSPYPPMRAETREKLRRYYEQDIRETETLTGLDLRHWLS